MREKNRDDKNIKIGIERKAEEKQVLIDIRKKKRGVESCNNKEKERKKVKKKGKKRKKEKRKTEGKVE